MWLARFTSPNTRRSYERTIAQFAAEVAVPMAGVTVEHLTRWLDGLRASGAADSTIRQRVSAVKSLWAFAGAIGYLRFNPAAAIRSPRSSRRLDQPPSEEEVFALLRACELCSVNAPRNLRLLLLLYYGGLRLSEALGAKWGDAAPRDGGVWQLSVLGKGGKRRTILFPAAVWARVERSRNDQAEFIAASRTGGRLSARAARDVVYRLSEHAIGRRLRPHELRHAHATHAMERNCPIKLVADTLGHADLTTTSGYLHARPTDSSGLWLAH